MEKRDALTLLDEYLVSSETRLRQNAITALAAIGTETSITKLVDVALRETNPEVRDRAETELAQLGNERADIVDRVLRAELQGRRPERRVDLWYLVNQLRLRGWSDRRLHAALFERVMMALAIRRVPALRQTRRIGPVTLAGIGGTVAGVLAVSFYLLTSLTVAPMPSFWMALAAVAVGAGALLSAVSTRLSTPLGAHYDRRLAAVTEIVAVLGLASAVGALLVAVLFIFRVLRSEDGLLAILAIPVSLSLIVAAVRGGTLMASGAWATPTAQVVAQLLAGAGAGILASTAILAIERALIGNQLDGPAHNVRLVFEAMWLFFATTALGVAAGFARVERAVPFGVRKPIRRRALTVLVTAAAVALVARATTLNILGLDPNAVATASPRETLHQTLPIATFPFTYRFATAFPQKVLAGVTLTGQRTSDGGVARASDVSLSLSGFRPSGRNAAGSPSCTATSPTTYQIVDGGSRNRVEDELTWGCFVLEVTRDDDDGTEMTVASMVLAVLNSRAARAVPQEEAATAAYALSLDLNVDKSQPAVGTTLDVSGTSARALVSRDRDFEFELPDRRIVRIAIRPPSERLASATVAGAATRPRESSGATMELLQADGKRASVVPVMVEAERSENGTSQSRGSSIEGLMAAGKYRVHASMPGAAASNTELTYSLQLETAPTLTATGAWTVTRVPSIYTFSVDGPRDVTINASPVKSADTELELFSLGGEVRSLKKADDPEVISMTLQPGTYSVALRPLSLRNYSAAATGSIQLSVWPLARHGTAGTGALRSIRSEAVAYTLPASRAPFERAFVVDFEQDVRLAIEDEEDGPDLIVELWRDGERVAIGDDPDEVQKRVKPGTYSVKVAVFEAEELTQTLTNTKVRVILNLKAER